MVEFEGTTLYLDGTEDNLFSIDIYCKGEEGMPKSKYIVRPDDKVFLHIYKYYKDEDVICVAGPNFLIGRDMLRHVRPGQYNYYVTLLPGESELEFRVTDVGTCIVREGHRCRR